MSNVPPADTAHAVLSEWEWDAVLSEPPSLLDEDPHNLTLQSQLDFLGEVQRQRSWLASLESRALVAIAGGERRSRQVEILDGGAESSGALPDAPGRMVEIVDERADLVAVALRRSSMTVRRQVERARLLHGWLDDTLHALERGVISPEHADAIARVGEGISPEHIALFERRVLPKAPLLTPNETAALARRVRARVDAAGEEQRRRAARKHLDVRLWGEDDGLACLMARLPVADASRVHAAIEARAREVEVPCDASLGERRVAALVSALCGESGSGVRAEIGVTVDLATLVGLADEPALVTLGSNAAEPVSAQALRELLADDDVPVVLRRLVSDPLTGMLLDRGRTAYRVPSETRAFLVARDGTCRFPGCLRRASACQIDHAQAWDAGGSTDRDNLGPLCVRHHLLKTHGGWTFLAARPDGATEWRGPDGREYVSHQLEALWRSSRKVRRPATEPDAGRGSRPMSSTDPPPF